MKRLLCVLLAVAILSPVCARAENAKQKKAGITVAFLDSLWFSTSAEAFGKLIREAGGKAKVEANSITVQRFSLDGVPVKRLEAQFDGDHLDDIDIMVDPGTSTYLNPGIKYEKLLEAATAQYGQPLAEEHKANYILKRWRTDKLSLDLTYFNGRTGQKKTIWVFVDYVDPDKAPPIRQPIEMPHPTAFVWDDFRHHPDIGKEDKPGEVRMGMPREQVMAAQVTELQQAEKKSSQKKTNAEKAAAKKSDDKKSGDKKSDEANAIRYVGFLAGSMASTCEYRFDGAGKLEQIELRFTEKPIDPNDDIFSFEQVEEWMTYAHYGPPAQENPMVWTPKSKANPQDGSLWIKSVIKGELTYRATRTIGDVHVEHLLTAEKGKVVHLIRCVLVK